MSTDRETAIAYLTMLDLDVMTDPAGIGFTMERAITMLVERFADVRETALEEAAVSLEARAAGLSTHSYTDRSCADLLRSAAANVRSLMDKEKP